MTKRKPAGVSFETWVDKQVREAMDRGEFDNVPGTGEPIRDLDTPYEELMVTRILQREGVSTEDMLPTPLKLRKEIERLPDTVRVLTSEQAVRKVVEELNERITDWYRMPSGPQVNVGLVDVGEVVEQWRADQPEEAAPDPELSDAQKPRRARWWRRRR